MAAAARSGYIKELDGVRGIACIMVLIAHCILGILTFPPDSLFAPLRVPLIHLLVGGVDLFFVLSGFLIGGILMDNQGASNYFRAFWSRRVARILPVAYVLIATYVAAVWINTRLDLPVLNAWLLQEPRPPIWTYLTFTQNIPLAFTGTIDQPRWLGITWSLAIEEQFYFLFPVLAYFVSRRSLVWTAVAAIVIAPIVRFYLFRHYDWYAAYILLPGRMDNLMFGVLVAVVIRNQRAFAMAVRLRYLLDAILIAIFCSIVFLQIDRVPVPMIRYTPTALMYALVILRVFLYQDGIYNAVLRSPLLVKAGLISYALYMYHQAVNGLMHGIILNQVPKIESWLEFGVALGVIAVAVGLATLSYFFLEAPIRRLGHRVKFEHAGRQAAMPAAGVAGQPAGSTA
jgi:peptidoglycan/LPS O-acetylase OafA/YrhL